MTPREIAAYGVQGDFPRGESEALGIAKITDWIEQAISAAVEAEREACAKIAKNVKEYSASINNPDGEGAAREILEEIRARSTASSTPQAD